MNPIIQRAEGRFLAAYAGLLTRTARLSIRGREYFDQALAEGAPTVYAAWHGQTHLIYPAIRARRDIGQLVVPIVNDDRKYVLESFARGIRALPFSIGGNDQSIASARNLIELARLLRQGRFSYITPDGPDGPARIAKRGVAFLAARSGSKVIPLGSYCSTAYQLRRWDRYALPLPFSRIRIVVRPPLSLGRHEDEAEFLKQLSVEMTGALLEAEGE